MPIMTAPSVYHEGERLVQERTGERDQAARVGGIISDRIRRSAMPLLESQTMVVLGSVDEDGEIWASHLFGAPGFMAARDDRTLEFDLSKASVDDRDPFWANIASDPRVGLLAIDVLTRKRFRVNGDLARVNDHALRLDVLEAYPNCPKYIQRRESKQRRSESVEPIGHTSGDLLSPVHLDSIQAADTFFVASAHGERGVDVSHRGGNPGFIRVLDQGTLRIPDYVGNSMYQTLGNFVANPRAGLVFVDYETNRSLQLIGTPTVRFDLDESVDASGGTRRYWDFAVKRWVERPLPLALEWQLLDYSPFNP
jgi:predicted pyridoxine 5'-phosphate oxidase superfamily flavin-nucleotide-binding protein